MPKISSIIDRMERAERRAASKINERGNRRGRVASSAGASTFDSTVSADPEIQTPSHPTPLETRPALESGGNPQKEKDVFHESRADSELVTKKRKAVLDPPIDVQTQISEIPDLGSVSGDHRPFFGLDSGNYSRFSALEPKLPDNILHFLSAKGPNIPLVEPYHPIGKTFNLMGKALTHELNDLTQREDLVFPLTSMLAYQTAFSITAANDRAEKMGEDLDKAKLQISDLTQALVFASEDRDKWKTEVETLRLELEKKVNENSSLKMEVSQLRLELEKKVNENSSLKMEVSQIGDLNKNSWALIEDLQNEMKLRSEEMELVRKVESNLKEQLQQSRSKAASIAHKLDQVLKDPKRDQRVFGDHLYVNAFVDLIRESKKVGNENTAAFVFQYLKDYMDGRALDARIPQPFLDLEHKLGFEMAWWPGYDKLILPDYDTKDDEDDKTGIHLIERGSDGVSISPPSPIL